MNKVVSASFSWMENYAMILSRIIATLEFVFPNPFHQNKVQYNDTHKFEIIIIVLLWLVTQ